MESNTKKARSVPRWQWRLGNLVLAVLIFGLGINVGNGRIGWHIGASENKSLPSRLDFASVNEIYSLLKTNYDGQLDATKLLDGLKGGLSGATGDPYTEYFNPAQAKDFTNQLNGSFTGIGAELGNDRSGNLIVVSPIAGSPAAKAGLRAQDIVATINGTSTGGLSLGSAVEKIRGPKGSQVTLEVVRGSQNLTITIVRDDITVPSVNSKILDGNIGYLQINQFSDDASNDTSALATKAAQSFKQAKVKGVVLDLRDNPGGALDAAVNVSSLWLPSGKMVLQEKRGNTVVQSYTSNGNDILQGIPTAVLINAGSASAAEITAGALRDNSVATLIGITSFGKGSVQEVDPLKNGGELKVTIAHWYRPNGQNINHKGITPDQSVPMTDADYKAGADPQKDAAIQFLSK